MKEVMEKKVMVKEVMMKKVIVKEIIVKMKNYFFFQNGGRGSTTKVIFCVIFDGFKRSQICFTMSKNFFTKSFKTDKIYTIFFFFKNCSSHFEGGRANVWTNLEKVSICRVSSGLVITTFFGYNDF